MKKIEQLMMEIGIKHNTYCTFSIASGHTPKGENDYKSSVDYKTYISDAVDGYAHQDHNSYADAFDRFTAFAKIDDLESHNMEIATEKLRILREKRDDLDCDIERFEGIINDKTRTQETK